MLLSRNVENNRHISEIHKATLSYTFKNDTTNLPFNELYTQEVYSSKFNILPSYSITKTLICCNLNNIPFKYKYGVNALLGNQF